MEIKFFPLKFFLTNNLTIYVRFPLFRKSHNIRALIQKFSHHFKLMSLNFVGLPIIQFLTKFWSNWWNFWINSKYIFRLSKELTYVEEYFLHCKYTTFESDRYCSYNWSVWKFMIKYLKCRPLSINMLTLHG